jgi:hypothetical protein
MAKEAHRHLDRTFDLLERDVLAKRLPSTIGGGWFLEKHG